MWLVRGGPVVMWLIEGNSCCHVAGWVWSLQLCDWLRIVPVVMWLVGGGSYSHMIGWRYSIWLVTVLMLSSLLSYLHRFPLPETTPTQEVGIQTGSPQALNNGRRRSVREATSPSDTRERTSSSSPLHRASILLPALGLLLTVVCWLQTAC